MWWEREEDAVCRCVEYELPPEVWHAGEHAFASKAKEQLKYYRMGKRKSSKPPPVGLPLNVRTPELCFSS